MVKYAYGLQEDDYLCGPASIQRAFRMHGVRISQERIAEAAGTHPLEGSADEEIQRGILHFGFTFDEFETDVWNEALAWLDTCMVLSVLMTSAVVTGAWDGREKVP